MRIGILQAFNHHSLIILPGVKGFQVSNSDLKEVQDGHTLSADAKIEHVLPQPISGNGTTVHVPEEVVSRVLANG